MIAVKIFNAKRRNHFCKLRNFILVFFIRKTGKPNSIYDRFRVSAQYMIFQLPLS